MNVAGKLKMFQYIRRGLRGANLEAELALNLSKKAFSPAEQLSRRDESWYMPYPNIRKLRSSYPLFARKFTKDSADKLLSMLLENDEDGAEFGIFNGRYNTEPRLNDSQSMIKD